MGLGNHEGQPGVKKVAGQKVSASKKSGRNKNITWVKKSRGDKKSEGGTFKRVEWLRKSGVNVLPINYE